MSKLAPKSLIVTWMVVYCHLPSAGDPLASWPYMLNQKPDGFA
jgi:hypothetical protein